MCFKVDHRFIIVIIIDTCWLPTICVPISLEEVGGRINVLWLKTAVVFAMRICLALTADQISSYDG